MSGYRRPSLGDDFGYVPGEQPAGDGWLKLNTNESLVPPSPRVAGAIAAAATRLGRYPDASAEPLRSALASHHGVRPEQVAVGNGADDILDCCFRAFVEPGASVVRTEPTYSLLGVLTRLFGAQDVVIPVTADEAIPAELGRVTAALRFLVNPNSPAGSWVDPGIVESVLANAAGVVVIDEAYGDFAPASCIPLLDAHTNWLVVRTFSKSYALAGLRVGYAVGDAAVIADLAAVQDSYPLDSCSIAGAHAALSDQGHHSMIVDTIRAQRDRLSQELRARGWDVLPSQANFIFAKPPQPARDVFDNLRERRVLVRHFASPDLQDRLRITIGDQAATDRLLAALDR